MEAESNWLSSPPPPPPSCHLISELDAEEEENSLLHRSEEKEELEEEDDRGMMAINGLEGAVAQRPEEVEFARALEEDHQRASSSAEDLFGLLDHFAAVCSRRVAALQQQTGLEGVGAMVANSLEAMRAHQDARFLKSERDTWLLLSGLYKDRLFHLDTLSGESTEHSSPLVTSHKRIKQELNEKSRVFREAQIVLKWLEQLARLDGVQTYHIDARWTNTLRDLQKKSQEPPSALRYAQLVSSIDPDAPARQGKELHQEDAEDERRLLQVVWNLLRAGAKQKALELCRQSGQCWRAASLRTLISKEPLLLFDDGTKDAYSLWQLVCRSTSTEERCNEYERAIYATLCGNVSQIIPVCYTWEDHVWAKFKGLAHDLLHDEIQRRRPNMPQTTEHHNEGLAKQSVTEIFDRLLKSDILTIRQATNEPHHIIQTHLILNNERHLLDDLSAWVLSKESVPCPPVLIRFAAHLGLFFRQVRGRNCPHVDDFLEAYVKHLIKTKQTVLVALYTAKLPKGIQVETYASFLRDITQRQERERCLELAHRAGLNVNAITKRVVELIQAFPEEAEPELPMPPHNYGITPEDEAAIRAIDWLTFDPEQRIDALIHANALARQFILAEKYHALASLLQSLPPADSKSLVKRRWSIQKNPGEENVVHEYLCYDKLNDARAAYEAWVEHRQQLPKAPEALPASASVSVQEAHNNQNKAYEEELHNWKSKALGLTDKVKGTHYNLLLFENGWLQDLDPSPPPIDHPAQCQRRTEVDALRRKIVPEVFFQCYEVLYGNNQFQDSVKLVDLLADEYLKLYEVFTKDQLRSFLALVRQSVLVDPQETFLVPAW